MRPTIRVLAIAGSLRRDSYNRRLLEAACGHAPAGLTVEIYPGLGAIPPFDEDLEQDDPAPVAALVAAVAASDGVLIASPEYNQSLPGVLKNALDWLSRSPLEVLANKPAAIIGATTGRWGTRYAQKELRHVLTAIGARVVAQPQLYLASAGRQFDTSGRLADPDSVAVLREVLAALCKLAQVPT